MGNVKRYVLLGIVVLALVAGIGFAVRPVERASITCGSVFAPNDVEVVGPAGTDPRPCRGVHDSDAQIAVLFLTSAALVGCISMCVSTFTRRPMDAREDGRSST